jgi:hypothetical protein
MWRISSVLQPLSSLSKAIKRANIFHRLDCRIADRVLTVSVHFVRYFTRSFHGCTMHVLTSLSHSSVQRKEFDLVFSIDLATATLTSVDAQVWVDVGLMNLPPDVFLCRI